jgi:hypothetical protein
MRWGSPTEVPPNFCTNRAIHPFLQSKIVASQKLKADGGERHMPPWRKQTTLPEPVAAVKRRIDTCIR